MITLVNEVELKNELPVETDSELVGQAKFGDQEAFGVLVERYQSLACSVAYSRCGDLATSEDVAQEAFVKAWQKLSTLRETAKFKSWLCTIVRNLTVRKLERKARSVADAAATLESVGDVARAGNSPLDEIVSGEEETLVWAALSEIPENLREPMILYYREDQSVAHVASALDLTQDAVKQRLSRGRKLLRGRLETTIASTLDRSKPAKAFASAVMLAIASLKTKTAAAAGLGTGLTFAGRQSQKSASWEVLARSSPFCQSSGHFGLRARRCIRVRWTSTKQMKRSGLCEPMRFVGAEHR